MPPANKSFEIAPREILVQNIKLVNYSLREIYKIRLVENRPPNGCQDLLLLTERAL